MINKMASGYDSILLQTDDQSIDECLVSEVDRDIVVFSELPRYSPDSDPHGSSQFHDSELLTDFLSTILLISRCKTVILTTSNVSLWIAMFRGRTEGLIHVSDFGLLRKATMFLSARSGTFHSVVRRARRRFHMVRG